VGGRGERGRARSYETEGERVSEIGVGVRSWCDRRNETERGRRRRRIKGVREREGDGGE
jgi:hypothetical protein